MATGREAFGYPKSFGWANMASSPTDPGPLWADAFVLKTYTPATQVTRERIITLQRDPAAAPGASFGTGIEALREVLHAIRAMDSFPGIDWGFLVQLLVDALGRHLPIVFLKQFRDAVDPTAACYQAVVEANATVTEFRGAGFLPPAWTMQLQQYASAPIVTELAIPASATLDVGFWVDYSFSMDLGREVWRAP
jgi:hypothetical protein